MDKDSGLGSEYTDISKETTIKVRSEGEEKIIETTTELGNEVAEVNIDSSVETTTGVRNERDEKNEGTIEFGNEGAEINIASSEEVTTGVISEENVKNVDSSEKATSVVRNKRVEKNVEGSTEFENVGAEINIASSEEATTGVISEENVKNVDRSEKATSVVRNEGVEKNDEGSTEFENEGAEINIGSSEEATTEVRNEEDEINVGCSKESTPIDFGNDEDHDEISSDYPKEDTAKGFVDHDQIAKKKEIEPPQDLQIEQRKCEKNKAIVSGDKDNNKQAVSEEVELTEVVTEKAQETTEECEMEGNNKDVDSDCVNKENVQQDSIKQDVSEKVELTEVVTEKAQKTTEECEMEGNNKDVDSDCVNKENVQQDSIKQDVSEKVELTEVVTEKAQETTEECEMEGTNEDVDSDCVNKENVQQDSIKQDVSEKVELTEVVTEKAQETTEECEMEGTNEDVDSDCVNKENVQQDSIKQDVSEEVELTEVVTEKAQETTEECEMEGNNKDVDSDCVNKENVQQDSIKQDVSEKVELTEAIFETVTENPQEISGECEMEGVNADKKSVDEHEASEKVEMTEAVSETVTENPQETSGECEMEGVNADKKSVDEHEASEKVEMTEAVSETVTENPQETSGECEIEGVNADKKSVDEHEASEEVEMTEAVYETVTESLLETIAVETSEECEMEGTNTDDNAIDVDSVSEEIVQHDTESTGRQQKQIAEDVTSENESTPDVNDKPKMEGSVSEDHQVSLSISVDCTHEVIEYQDISDDEDEQISKTENLDHLSEDQQASVSTSMECSREVIEYQDISEDEQILATENQDDLSEDQQTSVRTSMECSQEVTEYQDISEDEQISAENQDDLSDEQISKTENQDDLSEDEQISKTENQDDLSGDEQISKTENQDNLSEDEQISKTENQDHLSEDQQASVSTSVDFSQEVTEYQDISEDEQILATENQDDLSGDEQISKTENQDDLSEDEQISKTENQDHLSEDEQISKTENQDHLSEDQQASVSTSVDFSQEVTEYQDISEDEQILATENQDDLSEDEQISKTENEHDISKNEQISKTGNPLEIDSSNIEVKQSTKSADKDISEENIVAETNSQSDSEGISNLQGSSGQIDSNKMEVNQSTDSAECDGKSITVTKEFIQTETSSSTGSNVQGLTGDMESHEMEIEQSNKECITIENIETETAFKAKSNSQVLNDSEKMETDQNRQPTGTEEHNQTEIQENPDQSGNVTDATVQNEPSDSGKDSGEYYELHPLSNDLKQKTIEDKNASSTLSFPSSMSSSSSSAPSSGCTFTFNKNIFAELKSKCTKGNIKLSPKSTHQRDKNLSFSDSKGEHGHAHKVEESDRNIFSIFGNRLGKEKMDVGEKVECESMCVQEAFDTSQSTSEKDGSAIVEKNKGAAFTSTCDKTPSDIGEKETCSPCGIENTCVGETGNSGENEQIAENNENVVIKLNETNIKSCETHFKITKSDLSKGQSGDIVLESIETENIQVVKEESLGNKGPSHELGIDNKNILSPQQNDVNGKENVAQDINLEMDESSYPEPMSSTIDIDSSKLTVSSSKVILDSDIEMPIETLNKRKEDSALMSESDSEFSNKNHADKDNESVSERIPTVANQSTELLEKVKDQKKVLCSSDDHVKEQFQEELGNSQNRAGETGNLILSDKKEVYHHLMYEEISSDEEDEYSNEKVSECEMHDEKDSEQLLSISKETKEKEMMSESIESSNNMESSGNMEMSDTVESKIVAGAEDLQENDEVVMSDESNTSESSNKVSDSKEEIMGDDKSAIDDENENNMLDRNVSIVSSESEILNSTKESDNLLQPAPDTVQVIKDDKLPEESESQGEMEDFVLELSSISSEEHERVDEKEVFTQGFGTGSTEEVMEASLVDQETISVNDEEVTIEKQDEQNLVQNDDDVEHQDKEQFIEAADQPVEEKYDISQIKQNIEEDQNILTSNTVDEQEVSLAESDDKNMTGKENENSVEEDICTQANKVDDDGFSSEKKEVKFAEPDLSSEIKSEEDVHHTCENRNTISGEKVDDTVMEEETSIEQVTLENNDKTEISLRQESEEDFEKSEMLCLESENNERNSDIDNKQMLSVEMEDDRSYVEVYEDSRSPPVLIEITEEVTSPQGSDRVNEQDYDSPPSLSVISQEDINVPQNNLSSDETSDKTEVDKELFDSQSFENEKEPEFVQINNKKEGNEMSNEVEQNLDTASGNSEGMVSMRSDVDFAKNLELIVTVKNNAESIQVVDDDFTQSTKNQSGKNNEMEKKSSTFVGFSEEAETSHKTKRVKGSENERDKEMQTNLRKRLDNEHETNRNTSDKTYGSKTDQNKSGNSSSNIGLQELKQLFQFITSASNIKNDKEEDTHKEENENVEEQVVTCHLCDEQFESKEKLNSHMQTCHSESVEGDSENVEDGAEKDSETETSDTKSLPANCVPFLYLMQKWLSQELDIEEEVDSLYSIDERADFIRGFYQNCSYDQKMRLVSELSAIPTQLLTLSFDPSHSVSGLLPNIECEMGCCQEEDLRLKTFIDYALYPSLLVEHLEIQRNHQHGQFPLVLAEPHCHDHDVKADSELQYENETDVKNDDSYPKIDKGCEGEGEHFEDKCEEEKLGQDVLCENEEIVVSQNEGIDSESDDSEEESLAVLSKKLKEKKNTQKRKRGKDQDQDTKKKRKVKNEKKGKKTDKKKMKVVKNKNKNRLTIKIVKKVKEPDMEKATPNKKQKNKDKEDTKQEKLNDSSNVETNASLVSEESEMNEEIKADGDISSESVQTEKDGKVKKTRKRKKDSDSAEEKEKKTTKKMKTTGTYITKKMQKTLEKNKIVATKTAFEGLSAKIATNNIEDKTEDPQKPTENISETVENTLVDRTENVVNAAEIVNEDKQDVDIERTQVLNNDKISDLSKIKDVKEFESKITNRSKTDTVNQNSKPDAQNMEFRNCDLCGMTFFKLEHYHKHVTKMHTVSTVHRCSRCGIECLGPKSLEAHENTHKFEFRFKSPLKHKCYTCNISFPTRALKEKHLKIHKV